MKRAAPAPRHEWGGPETAAAARSASFVRGTRFALASHVFACVAESHVVLLDLRRDEYYAIDMTHTRGLSAVIPGWPERGPVLVTESVEPRAIDTEMPLVVKAMLMHGLLVSPAAAGKPVSPVRVRRPERDMRQGPERLVRVSARDFMSAARAVLVATLLLRYCSLERIVARAVARRNRKRVACSGKSADDARLADRVAAFQRLRPLFFSARGACLLESLALLEFLAAYGIHSDWVFGVRTRPFAAHCWVQYGTVVCNDALERVCRFTPILVA